MEMERKSREGKWNRRQIATSNQLAVGGCAQLAGWLAAQGARARSLSLSHSLTPRRANQNTEGQSASRPQFSRYTITIQQAA